MNAHVHLPGSKFGTSAFVQWFPTGVSHGFEGKKWLAKAKAISVLN
jgi:hypothetical protein